MCVVGEAAGCAVLRSVCCEFEGRVVARTAPARRRWSRSTATASCGRRRERPTARACVCVFCSSCRWNFFLWFTVTTAAFCRCCSLLDRMFGLFIVASFALVAASGGPAELQAALRAGGCTSCTVPACSSTSDVSTTFGVSGAGTSIFRCDTGGFIDRL